LLVLALGMIAGGWLLQPAEAAGRGEPGPVIAARVELQDETADLKLLQDLDMDIDGVSVGWARVYLVPAEIEKLRKLGFEVTPLTREELNGPPDPTGMAVDETTSIPAEYHTYATLTADLQAIAAAHPGITRLVDVGASVQGRSLWMMKITDNPDVEEDEPEFAFISSMHGNEVVGKEMCFHLIDYLTQNYGTDARITDLIDETEIWIMPSMNPDGTEVQQRYNANGYDLNRNFPDQFVDPVNSPDGRQPETQLIMAWREAHSINLSANMHGGELIANYPFDGNPEGANDFSPTPDPDHLALVSISRTYADLNLPMAANNSHPSFDNGICNGADWYLVRGGMQDYAYVWHGTFEVTLELSYEFWPAASALPTFWDENLESMLAYMERVHGGIRGIVTDAETGAPVPATVYIDSNPFPTYADPDVGDYHRIVEPGTYSIEVSAEGYASQTVPVTVIKTGASRYDVALQPLPTDLQPMAHQILDGPDGDGNLDPGESTDLLVTLQNRGRSASGGSGQLEPTGWFAEITRTTATYADIATGANAPSDFPHYGITLDSDVPPGHKVGFALRWQAAQGSGLSEPFFVDVGSPTCETLPAVDVPQAINDNSTTTSQLVVGTDVELADVQVALDISHTYIGDLIVTLTSPTGTPVVLHNRGGGSTHDIVGTYGVDLTPAESLAALAGEGSGGTWELSVSDNAGSDTGTLNSWSLTYCGRAEEASTPEMRFRLLTPESDGIHLTWWPYPGLDSYRVYRSSDPSSPAAFIDVTAEDGDPTDTFFLDNSANPLSCYLVTGVGPQGEGPKGHFGE
jgi:carboxypeptidase D